jgi:uncharacterized YigZ family protein
MEAEHDFSYLTIRQPSQGSFRDRNSRFLAFAFPVKSEDEVATNLQQLKKQYHDARHFCYAYIIGQDKSRWRANDDGEPSGSAGLPIYNQCLSLDLTNIFVVVVRYFGGTKLGVPGLINAYKTATRLALEYAEIISVVPSRTLEIQFGYEMMNTVMSFCKNNGLEIESKNFSDTNSIIVLVPADKEQNVAAFLVKNEMKFCWLS